MARNRPMLPVYDVIVVGSGNAGFSAAASAKEYGAKDVLLLEKAPESWAGGNTTFTAGAYRTVFHGLDDILPLVNNVSREVQYKIDMQPYTEDDFMKDLKRVTNNECDQALARKLVQESNDTTKWLAKNGVKFQLSFNRQAYEIDGRYKFWGGMVLMVEDGGKGLTRNHQEHAARIGVEVLYECAMLDILQDAAGRVTGVKIQFSGVAEPVETLSRGGVVLASGGFEASKEMRKRHLGQGWENAFVRGTPYNIGDCHEVAISRLQAEKAGHWSGCHSTCWDANADINCGNQSLTNQFTKSGYPLGLMYNINGERFVDEGLDMRNFTYARFGREILKQPGSVAFQIWDADGSKWLREEEYADDVVQKINCDTIPELARTLSSNGLLNPEELIQSLTEYNEAVAAHRKENPEIFFDPSQKDGLSTRSSAGGLTIDKTNWALPILKPPFLAVKVTCGITFTFGGLRIDPSTAAVVSRATSRPIPGLFAAGEIAGGLFFHNYPGGSGLTAGAVFGRLGGKFAALRGIV